MQVSKVYKVAVIDENLVSRLGLSTIINDLQDFKVVLKEVILVFEFSGIEDIDVILFSIKALDLDFTHRLTQFRKDNENLPIIVFALNLSLNEQFSLINLGIKGLITDKADQEVLDNALHCAIYDGSYYPKEIMRLIMNERWRSMHNNLVTEAFTERQKEVMRYLALGYTAQQIADKLYRSRRTIEMHQQAAMRTAKVKSARQLLLFAIEYGIIDSPFRNTEQTNVYQPLDKKLHSS